MQLHGIGPGQQQHELLAAVAEEPIAAAGIGAHEVGERLQHAVARIVPGGVVDALEVVEVHHRQAHRTRLATLRGDHTLQLLFHRTSIRGAGQRVLAR